MSRSELEILSDAVMHLDASQRYTTMEAPEDILVDAISLRLASMIDLLGRLNEDTLIAMFGPTWHAMRGLRNRIAHGYHSVNPDVVRLTVTQELPNVRAALMGRIKRLRDA